MRVRWCLGIRNLIVLLGNRRDLFDLLLFFSFFDAIAKDGAMNLAVTLSK